MTGPEHYLEAESLLASAADADRDAANDDVRLLVEFAQVHATLAHAAATALNQSGDEGGGMSLRDYEAWEHASACPVPAEEGTP